MEFVASSTTRKLSNEIAVLWGIHRLSSSPSGRSKVKFVHSIAADLYKEVPQGYH